MIKYVFLTTVLLCIYVLDSIITTEEIERTIAKFLAKED